MRIDRNLLKEKLKAFGNEEQGSIDSIDSIATFIAEELYYKKNICCTIMYNYNQLIFNTLFHALVLRKNSKGKKYTFWTGHSPANQEAEVEFSEARESL